MEDMEIKMKKLKKILNYPSVDAFIMTLTGFAFVGIIFCLVILMAYIFGKGIGGIIAFFITLFLLIWFVFYLIVKVEK